MFSKFTEECQKVLLNSKKEMQKLKHPYVGSEHLLLSILSMDNSITRRLNDLGVTYQKFREQIINMVGIGEEENSWFLYTPLLKRVLESSILDSKDNNNALITLDHLFLSLLEEGEGIAIRMLLAMHVNVDNLYNEFYSRCKTKRTEKAKKLKVYEYGSNLVTQANKGLVDPVIGREKEVTRLIEILSRRRKNNPLLLGEAGVGKSAVVEELARRIASEEVPIHLRGKKILSIAMSSLVSGTKYRGEFEERINKIVKELESNRDIIVFIDEIHTLVGAGGAEGAIDASNILKPALARGNIQIIGATTTEEYKKYIEKDRALARRFQTIYLEETDREKTISILKVLTPIYEKYHHVHVSSKLLEYITDMSNKYIKTRKQPDKAIDILDEACVRVSLKENKDEKKLVELKQKLKTISEKKKEFIKVGNYEEATNYYLKEKNQMDKLNRFELKMTKEKHYNEVSKKDIAQIIEEKSQVQLYEDINAKKFIQDLRKNLQDHVKGQNEAIDKLTKATKKALYSYRKIEKPLSLLFVGATGLGKTYMSKVYSKYMFKEDKLIKLDMSEYKDEASINKLIGSPAGYIGYDDKKSVFETLKEHPHCVVLLDEIEKAHPSVLNLFLQILDEGKIKNSSGEDIYFSNCIFIMTSNAGCHKNTVGFLKQNANLIDSLKNYFSLEFLNRIDDVVLFKELSEDVVREIIKKKVNHICHFYKKKGIDLSITKSCENTILEKSQYKKFGARRLDKIIEEVIDEKVVDQICEGNVIIHI